jgi:hypothetical protein
LAESVEQHANPSLSEAESNDLASFKKAFLDTRFPELAQTNPIADFKTVLLAVVPTA